MSNRYTESVSRVIRDHRGSVVEFYSADRWIWSAIGTTTNLAARLQDLSKALEAKSVIDTPTWEGAGSSQTAFQRRAQVSIRGLDMPLDLYLVLR